MLTVSDFFRFFFFFFFLRDLLSKVSSPFSTFCSEVSLPVLDKFGPASLGPASSISLAAETALSALSSWAETDFSLANPPEFLSLTTSPIPCWG